LQGDYTPKPADIRNVTLTRGMLEMAERMAENAHDIWARKKKIELESIGECIDRSIDLSQNIRAVVCFILLARFTVVDCTKDFMDF
jgi:hypothetical protein